MKPDSMRALMGRGVWSREKPRTEGYFWYRRHGIHDIVRLYFRPENDQLVATGAFYEQIPVNSMDGEWSGPIPRPNE